MRKHRSLCVSATILGVLGCADGAPEVNQPDLGAAFDEYVTSQMAEWNVPGVVVIAARQGGEPILSIPESVLQDVWTIETDVDRQSGLFNHPTALVSYARGWA